MTIATDAGFMQEFKIYYGYYPKIGTLYTYNNIQYTFNENALMINDLIVTGYGGWLNYDNVKYMIVSGGYPEGSGIEYVPKVQTLNPSYFNKDLLPKLTIPQVI
jgi:hypothetical protein